MEKGIINFSTEENYWNQIDQSKMQEILAYAVEHGTEKALYDLYRPWTSSYHYNYVSNFSRADWHFVLGLDNESIILDIGPGWGAATLPLGLNYKKVVAADVNKSTLEFLSLRKNEFNIANIKIINISPLDKVKLPFREEQFDLIVLNGVLEWFAFFSDEEPQEVQQKCLSELRRVLKKDGKIYIGIENRYYLGYFFGSREHGNLPFLSVLPRFLANNFSKLITNRGYKTYLYSEKGYQKLFCKVGLVIKETFYPFQSYRDVDFLIHKGNREQFKYYFKNSTFTLKKIVLSVLFFLKIHQYFVPSFSFIVGHDK